MPRCKLFVFTLIILFIVLKLKAQDGPPYVLTCDKHIPKISFIGKAPSPWAIDGKVQDWQTILGAFTGNTSDPYHPPITSGFNFAEDPGVDMVCVYNPGMEGLCAGPTLYDDANPGAERDIQFLSFTHDDYNAYFYFRRVANSSESNSFYYFIDINADGFMNTGEPVFHTNFSDAGVGSLTLSRYIVDLHFEVVNGNQVLYRQGKGNDMVAPFVPGISLWNWRVIDNFPMRGTVEEVFNSSAIPGSSKLKKNEVFAASITENGYGVELSIPWSYLKYWMPKGVKPPGNNRKSLNPGDIFFYHLSTMAGTGNYNRDLVADNAGSCCHNIGRSGVPELTKQIEKQVIEPGRRYLFKLYYTNTTNAEERVEGIQNALFKNIVTAQGMTFSPSDFQLKYFPDRNCNGVKDTGEEYVIMSGESYFDSVLFTDHGTAVLNHDGQDPLDPVAPPGGTVCFIAELTLPSNGSVISGIIAFEPSAIFNIVIDFCDFGGGKAINQVGFVEEPVGDEDNVIPQAKQMTEPDVRIYPNPSNGTTSVTLPVNSGPADISIEDGYGRIVIAKNKISTSTTQFNGLKPGIYVVKVKLLKDGTVITRKLIVK